MTPFRGSGVQVFPLPAFTLPRFTHSHSRRVQQRHARGLSATLLANRCISALNRLNVSFSSLPSSPSLTISRTRQRFLDNIYNLSFKLVSRQAPPALCDHDSLLDSSFVYSSGVFTPTVPLQADLVSLPSAAGTACLLDLLPPHLASVYNDPGQLLLSSSRPGRAPPLRMDVDSAEYIKLLRRMIPLGMLAFTTQPKVVNGVFATAKPDGQQRLIINARRGNRVFIDPPSVSLPTPDVTARLCVPSGSKLYMAKSDLDNFYHRLLIPEWMWPYFALPAVSSAALGLPGADHMVYPCCRTLPMGWSHSVFVAQAAHEHLLLTKGGFDPADLLTPDSDSNLDRVRLQVYIDDAIFFGTDPALVGAAQDRYLTTMSDAHLPPKLSKLVRPTCDPIECLGLQVDGVELTIGLSPSKLRALVDLTRALLATGHCTGAGLSHLIGKWTWAAMACRPALSVFGAVYTFINKAGYSDFNLWASVRRELATIADLAPLLQSSLEDEWCPRAVAVDASDTGLGVVSTPLLSIDFDDYRASSSWSVIAASRWKYGTEHINALELRALATAVKWSLSFPSSPGRKLLIFSDSQVAIGALRKGRSSSPLLLRRLRAISSWLLASGLRLLLYWIPSEDNPADDPSRW